MFQTIDRYAALETNSHAAQRPAKLTADGSAKDRTPKVENCSSHGRAFRNTNFRFVDGQCDQCSEWVRDGMYGSAGIDGVLPMISSASNAAVPSEVVIPSPSWPAAA